MPDITPSYNDDLGGLLTSQERNYGGFTHKWTIDYNTLNVTAGSAADTVTIPLMSTGADWACFKAAVNVKTAFSEDPAATIAIGTKGNVDSLFDETGISSAGAVLDVAGGIPPVLADSFGAANTQLVAQITTAAVAPGSFTAGEMDIYLEVIDFNKK